MIHQIKITKFRLTPQTTTSLKATANVVINEAIEIIGFTVLHNQTYPNPVDKNPTTKKNGKYLSFIKIHDPELQIAINESILNQYYERSKT